MLQVFDAVKLKTPKGVPVIVIGNHIEMSGSDKFYCVGSSQFKDLSVVDGLTEEDGIVEIVARIEDYMFCGATHQFWVYGHSQRLSAYEPHYSSRVCKNGKRNFFAGGDCWLNEWAREDSIPGHEKELTFKVWCQFMRTKRVLGRTYTDFLNKAMLFSQSDVTGFIKALNVLSGMEENKELEVKDKEVLL